MQQSSFLWLPNKEIPSQGALNWRSQSSCSRSCAIHVLPGGFAWFFFFLEVEVGRFKNKVPIGFFAIFFSVFCVELFFCFVGGG